MKVIVKVSGFYGGEWRDASPKHVDMPDAVARAFLPPHGDQLALPPQRQAAKADEKKAG